MNEAQLHLVSSFVTLTYSNENLPQYGSLRYDDFHQFMRRARRRLGPVRFFMCGEYGEELRRPHYHAILFGVWFDDARLLSGDGAHRLYTSETLDRLWKLGHASFGTVTAASAEYVAGYCTKKVTGRNAEAHYTVVDEFGEMHSIQPEFARMSLKPGIGVPWLHKYWKEVATHDRVYLNDRGLPVPRLYRDYLAKLDPERAEELEHLRTLKSQRFAADRTPERLAVREEVLHSRRKLKTRKLEQS